MKVVLLKEEEACVRCHFQNYLQSFYCFVTCKVNKISEAEVALWETRRESLPGPVSLRNRTTEARMPGHGAGEEVTLHKVEEGQL